MISGHIIESFEQDGLFEHPTFNRVYLRSFVRSYATAVGVDADRAIEELNRALEGNYANELAVEYLDDVEREAPTPSEDEAEDTPARETPASPSAPEPAASESSEPTPADEEGEEELPEGSQQGIWIGIGIVIAILIAWALLGRGGDSDTDATSSATAQSPVADTARADTAHTDSLTVDTLAASPEPMVDIGDTMYFTVIAQDRLSPIRIRRDNDLRRPYYLNRGQAAVFPAQQQITIEQGLNNIRLLVNGHEYPVASRVFNEQLVLTRDTVQVYLDTTSTEPLNLVVPVDTFRVMGG